MLAPPSGSVKSAMSPSAGATTVSEAVQGRGVPRTMLPPAVPPEPAPEAPPNPGVPPALAGPLLSEVQAACNPIVASSESIATALEIVLWLIDVSLRLCVPHRALSKPRANGGWLRNPEEARPGASDLHLPIDRTVG